jgi:uncharacterized protein
MAQALQKISSFTAAEIEATWFDDLGIAKTVPEATVAACLAHFDMMAPRLRALLIRAGDGEGLSEVEKRALFWGVHILGQGRDILAFKPLIQLLRLPDETLDDLFGDALSESLPRVVVNIFDGNDVPLFDLLADRSVSRFVRWDMFRVLAFLTFESQIAKEKTEAFLLRFETESLADEDDEAWGGWQETITLLGLRTLVEHVERRSHDPILVAFYGDGPQAFYEDLKKTERAPDDVKRFERENIGYLDDMVKTLSWVDFERKKDDLDFFDRFEPLLKPVVNPWRNVGRNDPCPCGSGKKAKKCCLA